MGVKTFQSNFTNGEISDFMVGRIDFAKYFNSVHEMENMLVCPQGPATMRPGFRFIKGTKVNSTASRLIPFIFSEDDAFALEFGAGYIRFYKNRAPITKTYAAWLTNTVYQAGALVTSGSSYYRCIVAHKSAVSSTFSDYYTYGGTSNKWVLTTSTDTAYELVSPYAATDVAQIKFCQSCDVLYLFHPAYSPRKLMRVADDDWYLHTINFSCPPLVPRVYYPAANLQPGATTGQNVTFTTSAGVFLDGDVGRVIACGTSRAVITQVYSSTKAICDILDNFISTDWITYSSTSPTWKITGDPQGYLKPRTTPDVGEKVVITVDTDLSEKWIDKGTKVDLVISGENNWESCTASGYTYYYYLKRSASSYCAQQPKNVQIVTLSTENQRYEYGSGTDATWLWGDYQGLGYNTIYIYKSDTDSVDPDSFSGKIRRTGTTVATHVFRSADVGKYLCIFSGLLKITSVLNSQKAVCEVVKLMDEEKAWMDNDSDGYVDLLLSTWDWEILDKQWSEKNGYPSCGVFFGDRLFLSGVPAYPENIRGSVVGDYENFFTGSEETDALDFSLSGRTFSKIRWIEPREYLVAGTLSDEWRLGPENTNKPLTPANVIAKSQTTHGCADIDPITIGNCTLFVQAALRKIREFTLNPTSINSEFVAPDLTVLAEHVTEGGIAGMCYQQEPSSVVWVWMANGDLASFTYRREEDIVGWQRHPMENGMVESMISIPGDECDEVYAIIKRTVNGSTVRYVEVLEKLFIDDNETYQANKGQNAFFVDSGITYNGTAATTITGLGHLEGETVAVLADGKAQTSQTVTGGQITLNTAASVVQAGLPYTGKLTTVRPEFALQDGTSQGRTKRVVSMIVRVKDSGSFKAGRDEDNLYEYGFLTYNQTQYQALYGASDTPSGTSADLFTGDKPCPYDGDFNKDARLTIVQDKPLPLTVSAIVMEVDITQ